MHNKYEKLFELPKGVIDWLERITGNVVPLNPSDIFKVYKPLDRGNNKLDDNILSFSLPSISTCGMYCKGCYDIRAMRFKSARKKRYVNYSMAIHKRDELKSLIIKQIKASHSCEFVRLHVGGDFFSLDYVKMWQEIVREIHEFNPSIKFYTYTKTIYTKMLKEAGINVVRSLYGDKFNYGTFEEMNAMRKEYKGVICPVTVMNHNKVPVPPKFCGSSCTACMSKEAVFFLKH